MKVFKGTFIVTTEDEISVDDLASHLDQHAIIDLDTNEESPCGAIGIELLYDGIEGNPAVPALKQLSLEEIADLGLDLVKDEE